MYEPEQTTTLAIKPCSSCAAGMIEGSKFCRWCGSPQPAAVTVSSLPPVSDGLSDEAERVTYQTAPLAPRNRYHPVSGPLVQAVVAGVPASLPHSPAGTISKRMLLALMAIPIWVMIILLSPLDAYASAKIIGNRI